MMHVTPMVQSQQKFPTDFRKSSFFGLVSQCPSTPCSPCLSHFKHFIHAVTGGPSRLPLRFSHRVDDDNKSPCSQTSSKCDLCYCPHGGRSTLFHHFPGCIEHVSSRKDQTPAGDQPTAPAALKQLFGF